MECEDCEQRDNCNLPGGPNDPETPEQRMTRLTEQHPLIITLEQAWLINARVRDLLENSDLPAMAQGQAIGPILVNPQPLALQIIRAIQSLQTIDETSIMVCEAEAWFLERRFRHNDREPEARALLQKVHDVILGFHPELHISLAQKEVEVNGDDKTYSEALEALKKPDSDEDSGEDTQEDTGTGESTGDGPVLPE